MKKRLLAFAMIMLSGILVLLAGCEPASITAVEVTGVKTEFAWGEEFSIGEDAKVVAIKSDNTKIELTAEDFEVDSSEYNKEVAGNYTIVVRYKEDTTVKVSYTVTVKAREVASIAIGTDPDNTPKSVYYIGDEFSRARGGIVVTYVDGGTETLYFNGSENIEILGFDSSRSTDSLVLTVRYGGKEITYTVSVLEVVPVAMTIDSGEIRTYLVGADTLDLTDVKVVVENNTGNKQTIAATDARFTVTAWEDIAPDVLRCTDNSGYETRHVTISINGTTLSAYYDVRVQYPVRLVKTGDDAGSFWAKDVETALGVENVTNVNVLSNLTLADNITIAEGVALTVNEGVTLVVPSSVTATVNGTFVNNGTVVTNNNIIKSLAAEITNVTGVVIPVNNSAELINGAGQLAGKSGWKVRIISDTELDEDIDDAQFANKTIELANGVVVASTVTSANNLAKMAGLTFVNSIALNNDATVGSVSVDFVINNGVTLTIQSGRTLTINGELINNGTIANMGTIRKYGPHTGAIVGTGDVYVYVNNIDRLLQECAYDNVQLGWQIIVTNDIALSENMDTTVFAGRNISCADGVWVSSEITTYENLAKMNNLTFVNRITLTANITIAADENVVLAQNAELIINENKTLLVETGAEFEINGTMVNYGNFIVDGAASVNGTLTNNGSVTGLPITKAVNATINGSNNVTSVHVYVATSDDLGAVLDSAQPTWVIVLSGDHEIEVNDTVTIGANVALMVRDGRVLTVNGTLIVNGILNNSGSVVNSGTITKALSGNVAGSVVVPGVIIPVTSQAELLTACEQYIDGWTINVANNISIDENVNIAQFTGCNITLGNGVAVNCTINNPNYLADIAGLSFVTNVVFGQNMEISANITNETLTQLANKTLNYAGRHITSHVLTVEQLNKMVNVDFVSEVIIEASVMTVPENINTNGKTVSRVNNTVAVICYVTSYDSLLAIGNMNFVTNIIINANFAVPQNITVETLARFNGKTVTVNDGIVVSSEVTTEANFIKVCGISFVNRVVVNDDIEINEAVTLTNNIDFVVSETKTLTIAETGSVTIAENTDVSFESGTIMMEVADPNTLSINPIGTFVIHRGCVIAIVMENEYDPSSPIIFAVFGEVSESTDNACIECVDTNASVTMQVVNDTLVYTLNGNINIDGFEISAGQKIIVAEGAVVTLLADSGTRIGVGAELDVQGTLVNNGNLEISETGAMNISGTFNNNGPMRILAEATFTVTGDGAVNNSNAMLSAVSIDANAVNNDTDDQNPGDEGQLIVVTVDKIAGEYYLRVTSEYILDMAMYFDDYGLHFVNNIEFAGNHTLYQLPGVVIEDGVAFTFNGGVVACYVDDKATLDYVATNYGFINSITVTGSVELGTDPNMSIYIGKNITAYASCNVTTVAKFNEVVGFGFVTTINVLNDITLVNPTMSNLNGKYITTGDGVEITIDVNSTAKLNEVVGAGAYYIDAIVISGDIDLGTNPDLSTYFGYNISRGQNVTVSCTVTTESALRSAQLCGFINDIQIDGNIEITEYLALDENVTFTANGNLTIDENVTVKSVVTTVENFEKMAQYINYIELGADITAFDNNNYVDDIDIKSISKNLALTIDLKGRNIIGELNLCTFGRVNGTNQYYNHSLDVTIINTSNTIATIGSDDSDCYYGIMANGGNGASALNVTINGTNVNGDNNIILLGYYCGIYSNASTKGATLTMSHVDLIGANTTDVDSQSGCVDSISAYFGGDYIYNITDCNFEGGTGVYVKSGTYTFTRCHFKSTDTNAAESLYYYSNGAISVGSAFVIDSCAGVPVGNREINVQFVNCTFVSETGYAIFEGETYAGGQSAVNYLESLVIDADTMDNIEGMTCAKTQKVKFSETRSHVQNYADLMAMNEFASVADIYVDDNITISENCELDENIQFTANGSLTITNSATVKSVVTTVENFEKMAQYVNYIELGADLSHNNDATSIANNYYAGDVSINATDHDIYLTIDLHGNNFEHELDLRTYGYGHREYITIINTTNTVSTIGYYETTANGKIYSDYGMLVKGGSGASELILTVTGTKLANNDNNIRIIGNEGGLYTNGVSSGAQLNITNVDMIGANTNTYRGDNTSKVNPLNVNDNAGAYLVGYNTYVFNGCNFTGASGIYVKTGNYTFTDCTFNANSTVAVDNLVYDGNGFWPNGSAFVIDNNTSPVAANRHLNIQFINCEFTVVNANGYAIFEGETYAGGQSAVNYLESLVIDADTMDNINLLANKIKYAHTHNYNTVIEPGETASEKYIVNTCTICGHTERELCNHDHFTAVLTTAGGVDVEGEYTYTCDECGYSYVETCAHTNNHTAGGTFICDDCGYEHTAHVHNYITKVVKSGANDYALKRVCDGCADANNVATNWKAMYFSTPTDNGGVYTYTLAKANYLNSATELIDELDMALSTSDMSNYTYELYDKDGLIYTGAFDPSGDIVYNLNRDTDSYVMFRIKSGDTYLRLRAISTGNTYDCVLAREAV